jgi:hypothetical protein
VYIYTSKNINIYRYREMYTYACDVIYIIHSSIKYKFIYLFDICIYRYMYMYIPVYMSIHIYIYKHIYTYIHKHIHIYTTWAALLTIASNLS